MRKMMLPLITAIVISMGIGAFAQKAPTTPVDTANAQKPATTDASADMAPLAETEPVSPDLEEDVSKARLTLGTNRWIQMHAFLQSGFSSARSWTQDSGANTGKAYWSMDPYLGACRLIFNGQVSNSVYFFIQTDDLTAGKSSNVTDESSNTNEGYNHLFTRDAYIKMAPAKWFQFYTGLLVIPNSRINMTSQATTLGLDSAYHDQATQGYSNGGRDLGMMLRGMFFPKSYFAVEYRLGAFKGLGHPEQASADSRNKYDIPRVAGRIQFHMGDPETGYFYSENYLGRRDSITFGLSGDYQPNVYGKKDYIGFGSDVSFDKPISPTKFMIVSVQLGAFNSMNYPQTTTPGYSKSLLLYAQGGLLIAQMFQPYAKYSIWDKGNAGVDKTVTGGIDYYLKGHFANIKAAFDWPYGKNKSKTGEMKGTLQFQIYM